MLVDNPIQQQPYFSLTEFSDIFNTDLFPNDAFTSNNSNSPATASSSRASSPQSPYNSSLLTPPQAAPVHTFPDLTPSSFFNFLDDEHSKSFDPLSSLGSTSYDFIGAFGGGATGSMDHAIEMDIDSGMGFAMLPSGLSSGPAHEAQTIGIDPQLVGTPATSRALSDFEGDADDEQQDEALFAEQDASAPSRNTTAAAKSRAAKKPVEKEEPRQKLTLTIAPVKVGGHGKARKGTVQSGGVVKKSAAIPKEKENTISMPTHALSPSAFVPTTIYPSKPAKKAAGGSDDEDDGAGEDDNNIPIEWRPSPEVYQKMSSKEKRQLRNKISARNFRVRRKEYISALEGDIAERDRLLDAIRSELGSTQSENYALRQEIAALKRIYLDNRGDPTTTDINATEFSLLNLPPPAPLPAQSAAAALAEAQQRSASPAPAPPLLTPNTQKDVSGTARFWGGTGMRLGMGGITPVHRVVLPEVSVLLGQFAREKLQENMNPLLNTPAASSPAPPAPQTDVKSALAGGFEGYADVNPFTMKTLDAYRMHLWGKMAAQHQYHQSQSQNQTYNSAYAQQQQQPHLTGLASSLRPAFFATPAQPPASLATLLSGKHTSPAPPYVPASPPPAYQSAPPSPVLLGKGTVLEKLERERERERWAAAQREKETAVYAALASQTLLRKLGSAFWDAFSGAGAVGASGSAASGSGSGAASGSGTGRGAWDAEKVRRVLEGTAVVRVVDVEEQPRGAAAVVEQKALVKETPEVPKRRACESAARKCCADILEESMRSLSLGKKA